MRRYCDVSPEIGAHRTVVPERTEEVAAAVSCGASTAAGTARRRNRQRTS